MPIIMHNFDYNFHDKKQGALMEEMLMVGEILYSADDKDMKYTANMRAMTTYFMSKNQKQYEGEIASMMKQHTIIR
jgi:hypothetical protein